MTETQLQWWIQRRGPGGQPPLILRPDWLRPRGPKKIFETKPSPPPYLRVWMTPPAPPPLSQGLDPPMNCNLILITLTVCLTKGQLRSLYPCLVLVILRGQCVLRHFVRAGTRQTVPFIFYLRWSQDCLNPIKFMEHYVTVT